MKMPPQPSTDQSLRAENAELRARLEDAEEMLRAERSGLITAIRDITERQEVEAALRRNAALFSEIIEQAPGGVYVVDAQFCVAQMNVESLPFFASAQPLFGRDFNEVLEIVWGPEIGPQIATIFRHTLATGERYVSLHFSEQRYDIGVEQAFEWETQRITLPDGQHGVVCYFQEVTARERTEAALQLINERLTLAVKCSQVVLFQQDLELRYTWHRNPELGLKFMDFIGKRDADLMERAADATVTEDLKREVIRTGVGQRQEVLVHIQGVDRHYDLLVEPQRDAAGLISGVTCAAIDITDRNRAEEKQRETERNYQALADATSEIPYRMSADWSTMLPLDGREVLASSHGPLPVWGWVDEYLPRDEHARVRQTVSEAIAGKNLFEMEHRVLRLDGSTGWVRSRAVPILDENEEVLEWFGATSDITARKQAEERLRLAIAGSDLGTWHWDIRTGSLDWSERCLEIFGLLPHTAMSYEKFLGALHPEDRARAEDAVRRALEDRSEYRMEFRTLWPDGSVHWAVSIGRAYYDDSGEPTRMEGIALDITARMRAEEARHEMERNYRALAAASSEVAYRMSADWTTLLPLDGRQLVTSSDEPLTDWAFLDQNVPRDEHPRVRQAISEAIARKSLYELEHRVLRPDGSIGWTFSRAVPILDENEEVIAWFGAASDITARKQAEEERRLLASIVENSRDFIGIADMGGKPVYGNRAAMELVGLQDLEQVRCSRITDYFIPEQQQFVEEVVLPAVAKDGRWSGELTMQHFVTGANIPVWYDLFRVDDPLTGQLVNFATITRDLTESKRVEQALADRTELLNGVLEGTTDVIFVKDLDDRCLMANTACAAGLSFTPEQMVGKTTEQWCPPDLVAAVRQHDEAVITGGLPIQREETFELAGEARVFLTLKAPLRDGSSRVVGILGISRDITERKCAEEALRESEARIQQALRVSQSFTFDWHPETDRVHRSASAGAILHVAGEDAENEAARAYFQRIHPQDRERFVDLVHGLRADARDYTVDYRVVRADGVVVSLEEVGRGNFDAAGKLVRLEGVATDVTWRRQAEMLLRSNEERMRLATEATEVGIWEWNVHTGVIRWDAQMFRLYGVTPTTDGFVSYETWSLAVLPEDLEEIERVLMDTLRRCGKSTREFRILRTDDGECRWIHAVETVRADKEGKAEWVIGTNLDVTAQKNAERAIREETQRKDEFLAMLGHELRNPLNAIRHAVQISGETPDDAEACQWAAKVIDHQSRQLSRMVDDLLDVARINRGRIDLHVEALDLGPVLEQAMAVVRPLLAQRRQTFTSDIGSQINVTGDAARLEQVFVNLLTNAVKYTPENGRVSLCARNEDGEIVVTITDSGVGISAELLPHVFELFRQADSTLDRALGGLGIGLSVVKSLVEMHLGRVTIFSAGENGGTTVTVRLPLLLERPAAMHAPTPLALDAAAQKLVRVLIVDDHKDAAEALALLFKRRGFDVRCAHTGPGGVTAARDFLPSAVLLDLGLPGCDGYEVVRTLRTEAPFAGALFIAISGYAQDGDRQRCLSAGFDDHFGKPLDFPKLMAALHSRGMGS